MSDHQHKLHTSDITILQPNYAKLQFIYIYIYSLLFFGRPYLEKLYLRGETS